MKARKTKKKKLVALSWISKKGKRKSMVGVFVVSGHNLSLSKAITKAKRLSSSEGLDLCMCMSWCGLEYVSGRSE